MKLHRKALDAVDKAKAVLKNIFGRKKKNKNASDATPTAAAPADASSSAAKPTETTTAPKPEPAPATKPEAAPSAPAADGPAAPVPAAQPADDKKAEQAALTEVKKATQSRSSLSFFYGQNCDDGSRRRHKVGTDSMHTGV